MKIKNKHVGWALLAAVYLGTGFVAVAGGLSYYFWDVDVFGVFGAIAAVCFAIFTIMGFIQLLVNLFDSPEKTIFDTKKKEISIL